jgi:hypothetical protein
MLVAPLAVGARGRYDGYGCQLVRVKRANLIRPDVIDCGLRLPEAVAILERFISQPLVMGGVDAVRTCDDAWELQHGRSC